MFSCFTLRRNNYWRIIAISLLLPAMLILLMVYYNNSQTARFATIKDELQVQLVDPLPKNQTKKDDFTTKIHQRMKERVAHVQKTCQELGIRHDMNKMRDELIYSDQYKTIFCQIPKTGITHWKYLFADMDDIELKKGTTGFSKKYKEYQITGEEKDKRLMDPNWFKMTVVREPFERLVSAYRNKLLHPRGLVMTNESETMRAFLSKKDISNKAYKESNWKGPTFSDFVNYLVLNNPESVTNGNLHWMKFTSLCQPCDFHYDIIAHQETVAEDSKYTLKLIGAPEDPTLDPAYKHHTDDDLVFQFFSTVKPRERVFQLYNILLDDYIIFGYPPPPILKQLSKNA